MSSDNIVDERDLLADVPNALGYQRILKTDTSAYLVRQYLHSSLYDRLRLVTLHLGNAVQRLTSIAHGLSSKTLKRSGSHSNYYVQYEIVMLRISTMVISRQKIYWLRRGIGYTLQTSHPRSRERTYPRTTLPTSPISLTHLVDEHAISPQNVSWVQVNKKIPEESPGQWTSSALDV